MSGILDPMATCPVLQQHTHEGKQGLKGEHRSLFPPLSHSTDLEAAAEQWKVKQSFKRWDYLATGKKSKRWVAVEVHQANPTELIKKRDDTETFLNEKCPAMLKAITAWHVCAMGDIPPTARRRLADKHIRISRNLLDTI